MTIALAPVRFSCPHSAASLIFDESTYLVSVQGDSLDEDIGEALDVCTPHHYGLCCGSDQFLDCCRILQLRKFAEQPPNVGLIVLRDRVALAPQYQFCADLGSQ